MTTQSITSHTVARQVAAQLIDSMQVGEARQQAGCSFVKATDGTLRITSATRTFLSRFDARGFGDMIVYPSRREWSAR